MFLMNKIKTKVKLPQNTHATVHNTSCFLLQGVILQHIMWHSTTCTNTLLLFRAQKLRMSSPFEKFHIGFQASGSLWSDVKQQTFSLRL